MRSTFPELRFLSLWKHVASAVAGVAFDEMPQAIAQAVTSYANDANFKDGVFFLDAIDVAFEQTTQRVSLEHIV